MISAGDNMIILYFLACVSPYYAPEVFLAEKGKHTFDPNDHCDSNCPFDEVDEIVDVIPEVDGVVSVVSLLPTTFTLEGLVSGDTMLSIAGLDNGTNLVERYMHMIVTPAHKLNLGLGCDTMYPSEDPWVLPINSEVFAKWVIYDTANNQLYGLPEFEALGVTQSELDHDNNDVVFTMPDYAGEIALTSPLLSDEVAIFKVVSDDHYDGFEADFWPDQPVETGTSRRIETALLVDGHRTCIDNVLRVVTTMTPDICVLSGEKTVLNVEGSGGIMNVVGKSAGECRLVVSMPGFGWSTKLQTTVEDP